MPSVQGYSSLADGRYAAATGTHLATGEGQDMLSPRAVEDGTLDQLDTSVLLTLAGYLITPAHDGAQAAGQPAAGPAGTGSRRVAAGQRGRPRRTAPAQHRPVARHTPVRDVGPPLRQLQARPGAP